MAKSLEYNENRGSPEDHLAVLRLRRENLVKEIGEARHKGSPTASLEEKLMRVEQNLRELGQEQAA